MKQTVYKTLCDNCEAEITDENKAIKPSLTELAGIFMGDLGETIWFDEDHTWCSFACFTAWLIRERDKITKED
jgi:hypothetical protein